MITMSAAVGTPRVGDVLPAAADELPTTVPSFDDVLRRHVADRPVTDRPGDGRREPTHGDQKPGDRRIDEDRAARTPHGDPRSVAVRRAGRDTVDRPTRDTVDGIDDADRDRSEPAGMDAVEPTDARGANDVPADGDHQSAAAPSGQAPTSSPEAHAPSAPAGRPPVAVVPTAATGHALPAPIATATAVAVPTEPTTSAPSVIDVPLDVPLEVPAGVHIRSVTVERLAAASPTDDAAAAPTPTIAGPTQPVGVHAAPPAAAGAPAVSTMPPAPTTDPTTTPPTAGADGVPPSVTHVDGDASPTVPGAASPAPTAGPMPSGAPSSAALPPTAVAAATAATAAVAASESVTRPTATTESAAAGSAPTDARLDPALAGSANRPAATATGTAPGTATADAAATLPSPLHDAVSQAQRDLQIRRAEQVTRLGIDLATEGLGAIHVEASNAGGGLQLQLGADRATTRQLLAEHAAALRDELGAGGTSVSVDVGRGDAGRSDQRPGEQDVPLVPGTSRHTSPSASEPRTPAPTAVRTAATGDGGVDVRL